jgi:2-C-methyl-D-erythritol 4-phosphate cytidylyltransferase
LIRQAYEGLFAQEVKQGLSVTDDAMVVETITGTKVKLVEGSYQNIKITTPEDLSFAEGLLRG